MKTTVKFHIATHPELLRVYAALGTTAEQRARRYARLVVAIQDHLLRHDGLPPEATAEGDGPDAVLWLAFGNDLLVQYALREEPPAPRGWWDVSRRVARWLREPMRKITVIGLLPLASAVEAPPPDSSNLRE